MWKNISILGTFYRPSRIRCHKYGTFVAKIRMLEKLTAPGWKCQLVPSRCSSLSALQVKRKEKDISPKRHFKVYQPKGEGKLFHNQSHIEFPVWEFSSSKHLFMSGKRKDRILMKYLTCNSVDTCEVCPRCGSSCACTSCSGLPTSSRKPRKPLRASRSRRSHRFWGKGLVKILFNFPILSNYSLICV